MAALKVARTQEVKPARKQARKPARKRGWTPARRVACITGSMGGGMLACSLTHIAESIHALTGSPMWMSGCMAAAIDGGMIGCELALMVAAKHPRMLASIKWWALGYMVATMLASMVLNSLAFMHASKGSYIPAIMLGIFVPAGTFMLARISGHLAADTE